MKRIVSVINNKGGVGKTTTTVNLGAGLFRLGKKVLLIDMDPQANLTSCVGLGKCPDSRDICGAFQKEYPLPVITSPDGLDTVRSTINLAAVEKKLVNEPSKELLLKKLLAPVAKDYDYVLIDCPPSLDTLTLNALTASNLCVIPVELTIFALEGMGRIIQIMEMVRERTNPGLDSYRILVTCEDIWQTIQRELAKTLSERFGENMFRSRIRSNVKIMESQIARKDIFSYDSKSNGATDYMKVCKEFLELYL